MSRLQEMLGPGHKACYIRQTLMRKNIFTSKWFKEFEELQRQERAQARKSTSLQAAIQETVPQCDIEEASKSTSSQASEHKSSSPGPRGQASNPRNSVPGSGNQGTSESSQASGNRQPE